MSQLSFSTTHYCNCPIKPTVLTVPGDVPFVPQHSPILLMSMRGCLTHWAKRRWPWGVRQRFNRPRMLLLLLPPGIHTQRTHTHTHKPQTLAHHTCTHTYTHTPHTHHTHNHTHIYITSIQVTTLYTRKKCLFH